MEKTSGLILDYYDDLVGMRAGSSVIGLPATFPDAFSKTAQVLSPDVQAQLPDDVFALTLVDGDQFFKKFAMTDEGNTRLSIEYFTRTGHKLPAEAQKTAASNLLTGCDWYAIELPAEQRNRLQKLASGESVLHKEAFGLGGLLAAATVLPGAAREAGANLKTVAPAGGTIMTPDQLKAQRTSQGA